MQRELAHVESHEYERERQRERQREKDRERKTERERESKQERERDTKLLQNLFLVSTADDEKQTGNDVIIFFCSEQMCVLKPSITCLSPFFSNAR